MSPKLARFCTGLVPGASSLPLPFRHRDQLPHQKSCSHPFHDQKSSVAAALCRLSLYPGQSLDLPALGEGECDSTRWAAGLSRALSAQNDAVLHSPSDWATFSPCQRCIFTRVIMSFRSTEPPWLGLKIQGQPMFRSIKHVTRRGICSSPAIHVEYRSQLLPPGIHIENILSICGM